MSYSITIPVVLGSGQTGLTLKAAVVNSAGTIVTADLTGFTEIGAGNYQWTYASMPDGHRGTAVFYTGTVGVGTDFSGVVVKAVAGISPEECETAYWADIQFTRDQRNQQDEYTVTWFRQATRLTSGVTSPTIQVVTRSDGTDLVASTSLSPIGSTGCFKLDVTGSGRQTKGEAAIVKVTATIDGSSRVWTRLIGRDA